MSISHKVRSGVLTLFGLGLLIPTGNFFGAVGSLKVVEFLVPLFVFGIISVIGGLLSLHQRTHIIGSFLGVFIAGVFTLSSFFSLFFTPIPHPATLVFAVVVLLSYLEGLSEAVRYKYK